MENILLILAFVVFEFLMSPLVYLKTFYTLIYSTDGMFKTIFNLFKWTVCGAFYLLFILLKDTFLLIDILYMHDGCKVLYTQSNDEDAEDEISKERKLELFNEVRLVVIQHYLNERYRLLGGAENKNLSSKDLNPENFSNILELLHKDAKDQRISENYHLFQVKYVVLQDEWKQYSVELSKNKNQ